MTIISYLAKRSHAFVDTKAFVWVHGFEEILQIWTS